MILITDHRQQVLFDKWGWHGHVGEHTISKLKVPSSISGAQADEEVY